MPSEQATLMSTFSVIAATPSRTCSISRSSGPRTAATMQNSVAPVAAVSRAASTSDGMSSRTERTGVSKRPDCEQKWQSSGQPPVLSEMMPSTSTSGPHQRIRTSWASASASSTASSGSCSTCSVWASSRPTPRSSTCSRAISRMLIRLHVRSYCREELLAGKLSGALRDAAEDGPEVLEVAERRQIRVARPRADHDAGAAEAAGAQRLERQRGVVERAEARAGDDEHRCVEQLRHVGKRSPVVVEANQQPAGALD